MDDMASMTGTNGC